MSGNAPHAWRSIIVESAEIAPPTPPRLTLRDNVTQQMRPAARAFLAFAL
jgi:hypothetical protein